MVRLSWRTLWNVIGVVVTGWGTVQLVRTALGFTDGLFQADGLEVDWWSIYLFAIALSFALLIVYNWGWFRSKTRGQRLRQLSGAAFLISASLHQISRPFHGENPTRVMSELQAFYFELDRLAVQHPPCIGDPLSTEVYLCHANFLDNLLPYIKKGYVQMVQQKADSWLSFRLTESQSDMGERGNQGG